MVHFPVSLLWHRVFLHSLLLVPPSFSKVCWAQHPRLALHSSLLLSDLLIISTLLSYVLLTHASSAQTSLSWHHNSIQSSDRHRWGQRLESCTSALKPLWTRHPPSSYCLILSVIIAARIQNCNIILQSLQILWVFLFKHVYPLLTTLGRASWSALPLVILLSAKQLKLCKSGWVTFMLKIVL